MNQLIVVIINDGYEEEVMSAARLAGARGGTIISARGTAQEKDLVKFLGISLHPEKEIILILTSEDLRDNIMEAIKKSAGLATKGAGILFSLPVDSVLGVSL